MASEDFASEAQIKRLYAVLHSLDIDPKEWKKERNIASYERLKRKQCSDLITELEELEKQKKGEYKPDQGATVIDGDARAEPAFSPSQEAEIDTLHVEAEMARMGDVLRFAAREAVRVVKTEIDGNIDNQGLGGVVKDFTMCLFREYRNTEKEMRRGAEPLSSGGVENAEMESGNRD